MSKIISKARSLNLAALKLWGMNLLKFVAPTLAIFFGLLAQGVELKMALPVALLAFYQALSDLFGKWKAEIK